MRGLAILVVLGAAAGAAHAGPDPAGPPQDPCQRVVLALEALGDLTRAKAAEDACPADHPIHAKIQKALERRGYALLVIVTKPEGVDVTIDKLQGQWHLKGGDEIWLPPDTYTITAGGMQSVVVLKPGKRAVALLEVPVATAPEPVNGTIDFDDEGGGAVVSGPPPKLEHPSLLPDRYQKGVNVSGGGGDFVDESGLGPPDLDRARFGIVAGASVGAFTGGGWDRAMGPTVTAFGRTRARGGWALQIEAGWQRRGGRMDGDERLDQIAVPVLAHVRLWHGGALAFGAHAGLQPELRLDEAIGGAAVDRVGASAVGGLDGELPDTPLYLALRGEAGLLSAGPGRTWAVGFGIGLLL